MMIYNTIHEILSDSGMNKKIIPKLSYYLSELDEYKNDNLYNAYNLAVTIVIEQMHIDYQFNPIQLCNELKEYLIDTNQDDKFHINLLPNDYQYIHIALFARLFTEENIFDNDILINYTFHYANIIHQIPNINDNDLTGMTQFLVTVLSIENINFPTIDLIKTFKNTYKTGYYEDFDTIVEISLDFIKKY